ncbi:hypothetical protein GCM10010156_65890 [Planobispora rosea]|uniref:Uncharacterized protein n=1 Tax=Planobispora rosea TaxID=35762 RepID=A0A8J3S648_PLARO|nr:hypothetical protein [Planobispora rosea]GGS98578.1 hypothetical protein GCM10010156_65890 [Planobispora rosea]GIH87953.1 hypothetical protein Pro02_63610 [Planobispora rosea]
MTRPSPPIRMWHLALAVFIFGALTWALGSLLHAYLADMFVETRLAGAPAPDGKSGWTDVLALLGQIGMLATVSGAIWTIALLPMELVLRRNRLKI